MMKQDKTRWSITVYLASLLLTICYTMKHTTAKRFDINNNFGSIAEFDIPELIEINKVELVETNAINANKRPGLIKPKPEFTLPSFPSLPQFGMNSNSNWNMGTSLGTSYIPGFSVQQPPPSPNSPYYLSSASPPYANQNFGPPPRPLSIISSNAEASHSSQAWINKPQPVPVVLSEQSNLPPPWVSHSQPPPPPLFLEEEFLLPPPPSQPPPPSFSQQPPPYRPPQSSHWSAQTPTASAQYSSTILFQPPPSPLVSQAPQWSSQAPPQQQQPSWLYQPSSQPTPPQPSKPFSLYQQLNLHLLDPTTWEKLQDQKVEWHGGHYHQPPLQQPIQYPFPPQQQQEVDNNLLTQLPPPPPPPPLSPPMTIYLSNPNNYYIPPNVITGNSTSSSSENNDQILNPIDGMADYILPGQLTLPQYSNSDITIDDDKLFDIDDGFVSVDSGDMEEDEIMKMVE